MPVIDNFYVFLQKLKLFLHEIESNICKYKLRPTIKFDLLVVVLNNIVI